MKSQKFFKKAAAIVLASSMIMTIPGTAAAADPASRSPFVISSLWSGITGFFEDLWNRDADAGTQDAVIADAAAEDTASEAAAQNTAADTGAASGEEGQVSTYAADPEIVYFPVTLFDYDKETINSHILEEEATELAAAGEKTTKYWKGLYFSGGTPSADDGVPLRTTVEGDETEEIFTRVTVRYNDNYSAYENGDYYLDEDGRYQVTSIACEREWHVFIGYSYNWEIEYRYNGHSGTASDTGNEITLWKKTKVSGTAVSAGGYAGYDYWTGNANAGKNPDTTIDTGDSTRAYIYSGLVEDELDRNGNIQFKMPDGGIFDTSDRTTKKVYTNVKLPFEYDSDSGVYTFDSDHMAAYFDGTPSSGATLEYSEQPTAFLYNNSYQTGFFPFNGQMTGRGSTTTAKTSAGDPVDAKKITGKDSEGNSVTSGNEGANFWFGMSANISFTMNPNGRMTADENSAPVEFSFSGDDDVWVFIDGQLVLDLGGIHDSASGTINFEENTITMHSTSTAKKSGDVAGQYGNAGNGGNVSQGHIFNVFNEDGELVEEGKLNTDINTFCATDEHTLTIYYLERGGGLSNNKIQFNLPQRDSLSVSKVVSSVDSNGDSLSEAQQNSVNNYDFTFRLYQNETGAAGQAYSLYSSVGTFLGNGVTDAKGYFTLRNGQTAKFYGLSLNGDSPYHVEELFGQKSPYEMPEWNYRVTGMNNAPSGSNSGWISEKVTVNGREDRTETIAFVCENTLTHVDNASVSPTDDMIVIDYGLPVEIDVLKNDIWTGEKIELTSITNDNQDFGTARIEDNKIVFTLQKQLTNVISLSYEVTVTDGDQTAVGTATVRIIPATTMYYEENFEFIEFKNGSSSGWSTVGNPLVGYQETGFVGEQADSPYGSDQIYLNNQGDSYGTSKKVDTRNGAAQFSYQFTGTGTTVFARMTQNTGYLRIELTYPNEEKEITYRDTKILASEEGGQGIETLYNVPIYDNQELEYGTYTLTVTVAKAGTKTGTSNADGSGGAGSEFYLDGIRIYEPINVNDESEASTLAKTAYLRDSESNVMTAQMRNKILNDYAVDGEDGLVWSDETGGKFVTFTDTDGTLATAEEYSSIGPKNEVYLMDGQSIMFSLTDWDSNNGRIYLGVKAPAGIGTGNVQIGNTSLDIHNTVDCYYDISRMGAVHEIGDQEVVTFDIKAGKGSLISITNIKVTGITDPSFVIVSGENISGDEGGDLGISADIFQDGTPAYQISKNAVTDTLLSQPKADGDTQPVQETAEETKSGQEETGETETEQVQEVSEADEAEEPEEPEESVPDTEEKQPETATATAESESAEQKGDAES